jgi:hypothetical protein
MLIGRAAELLPPGTREESLARLADELAKIVAGGGDVAAANPAGEPAVTR